MMLSLYDLGVIAFYFVFMAAIGVVFRKFIGNTSDYFRGGGTMLWWLAGSSAFMVAFSAWTFTGGASKAYEDGWVILVIFAANALGFFFNFLYFAPRFRQMRLITAMQGVRDRYGKANEQIFTWLQIPLGTLYAGIWLNGLAVFVSAVFGWDIVMTIIIVGSVVLVMAVVGGAWAVVASDFVQVLILMPITVVAAVFAVSYVGGLGAFLDGLPSHHYNWLEVTRPGILLPWVVAILIKQFIATNNMTDAARYLNVRDSRSARRAALLGMTLFLVGPIFWFIPPMAAAITHPDIGAQFPQLSRPSEAAFVAIGLVTMPAGMIGLLLAGIFSATMSSMDSGLNRNAGFFVKNFYSVYLRPKAAESEQLLAGKVTTAILGVLVISAALTFSTWKDIGLFDLMLQFGALVALPYSVPLIWGMLIKGAPAWAGWSTVLVGFAVSLFCKLFLHSGWAEKVFGWLDLPLSASESSDWALLIGVFANTTLGSAWFLFTLLFRNTRSAAEVARTEAYFKRLNTPVIKDEVDGNDARQCHTLSILCFIYGGAVLLLMLVPNPLTGRLAFLFCGGVVLLTGLLLRSSGRNFTARR